MVNQTVIDINIVTQEFAKYRKFYLAMGVLGIVCSALAILFPDLGLMRLWYYWLFIIPGIVESILYGLGKKSLLAKRFPYLKIDTERIESRASGIFTQPVRTAWADVTHIDIKLFEVHLKTRANQVVIVDLNHLSDDNLKLVKTYIAGIKEDRKL